MEGDTMSIKVPREEYHKVLEGCENNLHGRLVIRKWEENLVDAEDYTKVECNLVEAWIMENRPFREMVL